MILKIKAGEGGRGLLNYIAEGAGQLQPMLTSMAGGTPRELAAEAGILRRMRPGLKKAIGHLMLSQDPGEPDLTPEQWQEALQIAFKHHFGDAADRLQFAAYQHHEPGGHQHLHVFFLRIDPGTGKTLSDSHSYRKNTLAARDIERHFGFREPPEGDESGPRKRNKSENSNRRFERLNPQQDPQNRSRKLDPKLIIAALQGAKTPEEISDRLRQVGIECEFSRRESGEIYGWKMRDADDKGGTWLKASNVSRDLSWTRVQERMTDGESRRDAAESHEKSRDLRDRWRSAARALDDIQDDVVARLVAQMLNSIARAAERLFNLREGSLGRVQIDGQGLAQLTQGSAHHGSAGAAEQFMAKALDQTVHAIKTGDVHALPQLNADPEAAGARRQAIELVERRHASEIERERQRHQQHERDI